MKDFIQKFIAIEERDYCSRRKFQLTQRSAEASKVRQKKTYLFWGGVSKAHKNQIWKIGSGEIGQLIKEYSSLLSADSQEGTYEEGLFKFHYQDSFHISWWSPTIQLIIYETQSEYLEGLCLVLPQINKGVFQECLIRVTWEE